MKRTKYCGCFTEEDVGRSVTAMGWVATKRDMGGVVFLDLRDREGMLQVVCDAANLEEETFHSVERIRLESVLSVSGVLQERGVETYNASLKTGTIELRAVKIEILSAAAPVPFPLNSRASVRESLRMQYRYLDIRHSALYENLKLRHTLQRTIGEFLDTEGFLQVETPMLAKSTPEGARDYLVPSRVHPGSFYALPQSPQLFKQLLMIGGIDRYYQFARCFRDEDLRADRQPEFTQVDMELSFVSMEDILSFLESLFKHVFHSILNVSLPPFPRLTWQESMDSYGTDKPDLRFSLPIVDVSEALQESRFSVFQTVLTAGGSIRALCIPGGHTLSRAEIDLLTENAISYGAKGMAWILLREDGSVNSILTKYLSEAELAEVFRITQAKPGDFILFCADALDIVRHVLGKLRCDIADLRALRTEEFSFALITDFPQFEYRKSEERFYAMHHPFTMPYEEDIPLLDTDPSRVRAQAYDVVLNGIELGSGSLRIYDTSLQQKIFSILGFSKEEAEARFGFFLQAMRYGTPPHGGFAFGFDRLAMLLCGAESLRDVIAFPKTKEAACLMTAAPSIVEKEQLEALSLILESEAMMEKQTTQQKQQKIDMAHLSTLAQLSFSAVEEAAMTEDLANILTMAEKLSATDMNTLPETAYISSMQNVFREDCVAESTPRKTLLENAPEQKDGYIRTPRVIES
ncbi:MAG: aspartate--tRNA ligase [Christensenellaceae bacterium]|jgi:aspartyl-tRNA synthetase